MSIGCGNLNCVHKNNNNFCSRSCRNAAIRYNIIKDSDINYNISNLQIHPKSFYNLFEKELKPMFEK